MSHNTLKTGDKYYHQLKFKQEDVVRFSEITDDTNPIHLDDDYASKTIFKRTIVHGFLSGAVFSKVFGTLFPGIGTIYLYQEMKFKKPVFVDETYSAEFEVLDIDIIKHKATIKCNLKNESGEVCIEGNAKLLNTHKFA